MVKLKTPAPVFEAEARGSENETESIVTQSKQHKPTFLRVGGNRWEEAPNGDHIAKCTKIAVIGRKLVIYFVVIKGTYAGKRARLFYNMLSKEEADRIGTDFGAKSKLFNHVQKLFPNKVGNGDDPVEIDLAAIFMDETFKIKVKRSEKRQATVIDIENDLGF